MKKIYVIKLYISILYNGLQYKNDIQTVERFEKFYRNKNFNIDKMRRSMRLQYKVTHDLDKK